MTGILLRCLLNRASVCLHASVPGSLPGRGLAVWSWRVLPGVASASSHRPDMHLWLCWSVVLNCPHVWMWLCGLVSAGRGSSPQHCVVLFHPLHLQISVFVRVQTFSVNSVFCERVKASEKKKVATKRLHGEGKGAALILSLLPSSHL